MKEFLSLRQLNKMQVRQLLDVAVEMKKIINAKLKRGPQFSGKNMVSIAETAQNQNSTLLQLAYAYFGGASSNVAAAENLLEQSLMYDACGVNLLCLQHDNFSLIEQIAGKVSCEVINAGSKYINPLKTLSILATLLHCCDRVSNLNVVMVGNKEQSVVAELAYVLSLFESNLFVCLPENDTDFAQKSLVNVIYNFDSGFAGADAVIDLGLDKFSSLQDYYGNRMGITKSLMEKARVDAPLLFNRNVVDGQQVIEYPYNTVDRQYKDFMSVCMAVLYTYFKN